MIKKENYKGFEITFSIYKNGFNMYNIRAVKYKHKGFKEEKYFSKYLITYTNKLSIAKKEIHDFIDGLKDIDFLSNGLMNAYYLPSIND